MVDCSHANTEKQPERQPVVAADVTEQIIAGNRSIIGLMLESNLKAGNQKIPSNLDDLEYGVSVTDGCIDWDTTETLLVDIANKLRNVLPARATP
jgi:3-deoxy-7-phosphoheptulonate synthase